MKKLTNYIIFSGNFGFAKCALHVLISFCEYGNIFDYFVVFLYFNWYSFSQKFYYSNGNDSLKG